MANVLFSNNASCALAATAGASATALTVETGAGTLFPAPTAGDYFYATLTNPSNTIEIVKCTARIGDTLTVVRGQDGTTAAAFAIGDKLELRPVAAALRDIMNVASTFPVTTARINDGAVTTPKIADLNVTGAKIANGSIDGTKLAPGAAAGSLGYNPVATGGSHSLSELYNDTTKDIEVTVDGAFVYRMLVERPEAYAASGGYRGMPQITTNANHTLTLTDLGRHLFHADATVRTISVPDDASLAAEVGSFVVLANSNGGAGSTIVATGAATVYWANNGANGSRTLAPGGVCWLLKTAPNNWCAFGFGVT